MSERYTFIDIYKKDLDLNKEKKVKVNQVVIPKIQRPYAQGRLDGVCTYVRNTLLNEMFENFKTDEIFDFNFVYGIVRPNNDEYVMELLDGQQRMTTLFLLYWYIANRELNEGEEKDSEIIMKTNGRIDNVYMQEKILHVDKQTYNPTQMEIKDNKQKTTIYILYNEVKVNSSK